MNRIEQVFGVPRVLLPVVHPIGWDAALESVRVAHEAGVKGVFLIDQGMSAVELLRLVLAVRARYPSLWVGVNLLGRRPARALEDALEACEGRIDGIWVDNAGIDEREDAQPIAQELVECRRKHGWTGLYFGGVAFKYQREVPAEALGRSGALAATLMDVVCTSGPGTGHAADLDKVIALRRAIGPDTALALASGVTTENIALYQPYVDAYLVGTGIEQRVGILDANKVAALHDVLTKG
jgi:hypothetical protein